jgi:hypothetical protein
MPKARVVNNTDRPARPEPDQDPAVNMPLVREQVQRPRSKRSERSQ